MELKEKDTFFDVYIYIFSIFSAAKQGFDLSFDGEIQLMLSIFCI